MICRMDNIEQHNLSIMMFNKYIEDLSREETRKLSKVITFCERLSSEAIDNYKSNTWFSIGAY